MRPAVALGHPDDLGAVVEVEAIGPAGVGQVARRAVVVDERARSARRSAPARAPVVASTSITRKSLVAALVVFERERAAVLPPHHLRQVVRIREQRGVDGDFALGLRRRSRRVPADRARRRAWRRSARTSWAALDRPATSPHTSPSGDRQARRPARRAIFFESGDQRIAPSREGPLGGAAARQRDRRSRARRRWRGRRCCRRE